jgi:outer membrane protein
MEKKWLKLKKIDGTLMEEIMKKTTVGILMLVLCVLLAAEGTKLAYINSERIMVESKGTQEAQATFAAEQQAWQVELQTIEAEIERLNADYEQKKMILTESGKQEAEDKINGLLEERQQFIQEIYGETGTAVQRNAELLEPIVQKMSAVIEKVAVDNNIDMVLDAASGGILYAKPKMDITDLVIEEMDKADDDLETTTPSTPSTPQNSGSPQINDNK